MASLRDIKKDINYLTEAVCSDVYTTAMLNVKVDNEKMAQLIADALTFRQEMIDRANYPTVDRKDRKAMRGYYTALQNEIMERVDAMFATLSAEIR